MTFGMEILIMVALLVFILTGVVNVALLVWYMKSFGPMFKKMMIHMDKMYDDLEDEEA